MAPDKYTAQPFVAGTPQAEVAGQTVLAFSENLEADRIRELLPKHGLGDIDPEAWYPHQYWMNVLKEINDTMDNPTSVFVAFGKKVVETAVMPPEIQTPEDVLAMLHAIHHANLRNIPEDEGYAVEQIGTGHYHVYENTPNPSDAIYGFLWGLMQRFTKDNEDFIIIPLDNPHPDDKPGTLFEVKWGPQGTL
ncbi:MAG: hypothetical protein ACLFTK_13095 [Anaerolineales bacterium]